MPRKKTFAHRSTAGTPRDWYPACQRRTECGSASAGLRSAITRDRVSSRAAVCDTDHDTSPSVTCPHLTGPGAGEAGDFLEAVPCPANSDELEKACSVTQRRRSIIRAACRSLLQTQTGRLATADRLGPLAMSDYADNTAMGFDFNDMTQGADRNTESPTATTPHDTHTPSHHHSQSSAHVTVYQTTGPDAHTGPISAPRQPRIPRHQPTIMCHLPTTEAPGRAPRQPRPRDPNAPPKNSSQRELELMKRLRKLEGIVEDLSGQIEVESGGKGPSSAGSPETMSGGQPQSTAERPASISQRQLSGTSICGPADRPASTKDSESVSDQSEAARKNDLQKQFGRLVLNDQSGSKRYVSSGFWAKINDELDSIREETQRLTDEDSDNSINELKASNDTPNAAPKLDHNSFIFGYRSSDVDLKNCHPVPSHVPFLWSVYQENVEPLTKLLHVPSMEDIIRHARKDHDKLTPGQEALVFAIYYGAVTSLEPAEVETNFGANRDALLTLYRFAVEQSLTKANFLTTSDIVVLQAFAIFLIVVRRHDESRFCWSLTGLLVHLARGMGLHRDGSHFNLSPLETEMRRRIWWALLVLDLRSAEELGADLNISDLEYDTQMPSNINDADISAMTTEFPEPREGRTDTSVALVRYEICSLARRLVRASSAAVTMCPRAGDMSYVDRERMLIDVYQRVESKFLRQVLDETDPLYWMAAMIARVIMAKMCLIIYQPLLFPGSDYQLSDDVRKRIYVAAIEILEYHHILNTDPRCKQYNWLFMTYTNWHAIGFTLIETCRRPWSALVERGWEALNGYSRDPVEYAKSTNHAAVFLPLRRLFIRARRHRDAEMARLQANPDEARRLDFEERLNPAQPRFGPVPGTENRMEQVRERWRVAVRPDNSSPLIPISLPNPLHRQGSLTSPVEPAPSFPEPFMTLPPQTTSQLASTNGSAVPSDIELSDAAMGLMNDIFNKNQSFHMTDIWPMAGMDAITAEPAGTAASSLTSPLNTMIATPEEQMAHQETAFRQQAAAQQPSQRRDDDVPPYLWNGPYPFTSGFKMDDAGGSDVAGDDVAGEDVDMFSGNFNWADWSQNIQRLEMQATQAQNSW
ncbi:hypothetical protein G7046_g4923 [Stylonectria norvegica]|nr:hypothetical protein G7046_g4923 [Stylonectria norvegica]